MKSNITFFDKIYSKFYISTNGILSFNVYNGHSLSKFPLNNTAVIAPFWSDIDTQFAGHIFHREIRNKIILEQINNDINKKYKDLDFKADWMHIVIWNKVPPFMNSINTSLLSFRNTFKVIITSDKNNFNSFVIFNYAQLEWPNKLIDITFQAGYSASMKNYFILESSNLTNLLLNTNFNKPGQWIFKLN